MNSYSRPNNVPHNINIDEKRLIKCDDSNCPRYNADGFYSHAIPVSLQTKRLKKNACALSKSEERNATAIVSQKIGIKKLVVKVSLDQEKNKLVVQRKRCVHQVKIMFF